VYVCIIRLPKCNIFENLRKDTWHQLRQIIVEAILSTDMAVHFDACKLLDRRRAKLDGRNRSIEKELKSSGSSGIV